MPAVSQILGFRQGMRIRRSEAAVSVRQRRGQSTSEYPSVRVSRDIYDQLVKIQQDIKAEHGWEVSFADIIKQALAGRKPVQP